MFCCSSSAKSPLRDCSAYFISTLWITRISVIQKRISWRFGQCIGHKYISHQTMCHRLTLFTRPTQEQLAVQILLDLPEAAKWTDVFQHFCSFWRCVPVRSSARWNNSRFVNLLRLLALQHALMMCIAFVDCCRNQYKRGTWESKYLITHENNSVSGWMCANVPCRNSLPWRLLQCWRWMWSLLRRWKTHSTWKRSFTAH